MYNQLLSMGENKHLLFGRFNGWPRSVAIVDNLSDDRDNHSVVFDG